MTNEQLERLAMDRACGQMNEDTEALLAAYLAEHPEAQQIAGAFAGVCGRCEKALTAMQTKPLPRAIESPKRLFIGPRILTYRHAAMLLLGVLLGLAIGRLGTPAAPQEQFAAGPDSVKTKSGSPLASIEDGFWKEKADALKKPKLWAVDAKTQTHESFWGRYRKELTDVKTGTE